MGVRFAPSPTGRFHVGNLRTAWISHELAKLLGLPWILRFEDIDAPRVIPGAREGQLEDMAALGLIPASPESVVIQSRRRARHLELFGRAFEQGAIYPCFCSRKETQDALQRMASAPHSRGALYAGTCRELEPGERPRDHTLPSIAWRFRDESVADGSQDFVIARSASLEERSASFAPAYNWACAIDDYDGGYRLLVRAWDLEHVAEQQRKIQGWVAGSEGRQRPSQWIFHCSLVTANGGERLEKRTRGVTLNEIRRSGTTPERLIQIFRSSFEAPSEGVLLTGDSGEARQTITLGELGLVI